MERGRKFVTFGPKNAFPHLSEADFYAFPRINSSDTTSEVKTRDVGNTIHFGKANSLTPVTNGNFPDV